MPLVGGNGHAAEPTDSSSRHSVGSGGSGDLVGGRVNRRTDRGCVAALGLVGLALAGSCSSVRSDVAVTSVGTTDGTVSSTAPPTSPATIPPTVPAGNQGDAGGAAAPTDAPSDVERVCVLEPDTRVGDLTYDELARYELNNGEPIPTLEQYLDLADSAGVGVLPEIKTFAADDGGEPILPSPAQLEQFAEMVDERRGIPEVLIGSFDARILDHFADLRPEWTRVWFRSFVGQDPAHPPTVDEMRQRAPSAEVLGLLNVLYEQGTSGLDGQMYDVPGDFARAGIPLYIWFNVLTGGDSADGGEWALGASPGWDRLTATGPAGIRWMATDTPRAYADWADSLPGGRSSAPAMVAHRGGGSEGISENSLEAFRQAVVDGAAVLETDVQWTRPTAEEPDGIPVLMHDDTINRTMRCRD